jgi:hypothetical protein
MEKLSGNLLNAALLALLFVLAAVALAVTPETLFAKVPLGRSGLIFYLAGGALIFWLSFRKGGRRRAVDSGQDTVREGAEDPVSSEDGETAVRVDEVRGRIRARKGRKQAGD